jgi:hypothetical protein
MPSRRASAPGRLVGGFLIGYSLLFALMWVGLTLASVVAGKSLDKVTHSVVTIDCTVLLPLMFFGGLWLWRRRSCVRLNRPDAVPGPQL